MWRKECMNLSGLRAIIFDMGGTLYRPALDLCGLTRKFLSDLGVPQVESLSDSKIIGSLREPDQWLERYMLENDVDIHWVPTTEEWHEYDRLLLRGLGVSDDLDRIVIDYQDTWDAYAESIRPELMPECREVMLQLREDGLKLAVASNRFGDPAHILRKDGIYELLNAVEYSKVPGYCKPSPYMLFNVADEMGINPRYCAYVGNLVHLDVVAAKRAEMMSVLLAWCDPQEKENITEDTIIIEHISELREILE